MGVRQIPEHYEFSCDICGLSMERPDNLEPEGWDYVDMEAAEIHWLLCPEHIIDVAKCLHKYKKVQQDTANAK